MSATRAMYSDIEAFCCNHSPPTPLTRRKSRLRGGQIPTIGRGSYAIVNVSLCLELYGGESDECVRFTATLSTPSQRASSRLEWEAASSSSSARDVCLAQALESGLQYFPDQGVLQLAFPTRESRSRLIGEISAQGLWRFSGGGDESGKGARCWHLSLMKLADVENLRLLADTRPALKPLLTLHDTLQRIANELQDAQMETPGETPALGRPKGTKCRAGNALQSLWIRLCLPPSLPPSPPPPSPSPSPPPLPSPPLPLPSPLQPPPSQLPPSSHPPLLPPPPPPLPSPPPLSPSPPPPPPNPPSPPPPSPLSPSPTPPDLSPPPPSSPSPPPPPPLLPSPPPPLPSPSSPPPSPPPAGSRSYSLHYHFDRYGGTIGQPHTTPTPRASG